MKVLLPIEQSEETEKNEQFASQAYITPGEVESELATERRKTTVKVLLVLLILLLLIPFLIWGGYSLLRSFPRYSNSISRTQIIPTISPAYQAGQDNKIPSGQGSASEVAESKKQGLWQSMVGFFQSLFGVGNSNQTANQNTSNNQSSNNASSSGNTGGNQGGFLQSISNFFSSIFNGGSSNQNTANTYVTNQGNTLHFALPAEFSENVVFRNGLIVQNGDVNIQNGDLNIKNGDINLGSGSIYASNIINSVSSGYGIEVSGGNNPIITNTGVTSVQGLSGDLLLKAGRGIGIVGLTVSNTATLADVRANGGCSSCLTDSDIQDNITIGSNGSVDGGAIKTGVVPVGNGGTGQNTLNDLIELGTHTRGDYLKSATGGNGIAISGASGEGAIPTFSIVLPASGSSANNSSNSGLEVSTSGISLLRGCNNGQVLKWNSSTQVWSCSLDLTGGAGGGISTVEENDVAVVNPASVLDFLGADFNISESPSGEANISLDYANSKITRSNQNETITGSWTFSNGLTSNGSLNLSAGNVYQIGGSTVLSSTTLGSGVVNSSLTSVGALNAGSITSGFGSIDTGADNIITTGTIGSAGNTTFTGNSLTLTGPVIGATSYNGLVITANTGVITSGTWHGTSIAPAYGGTGIDTSSSTGVPYINGGVWSIDTNALTAAHGGTGQTAYTIGDILYASGATALSRRAIGTSGQVLTISGGLPVWADASTLGTTNYWQLNSNALSPANSTYDVLVGSNATGSALARFGGTTGSDSFFNTGGNLGIGTTTPSYKLSLAGTSSISDRTIGINGTPVIYLPDQGTGVGQFQGSLAIGDGLDSLSNASGLQGRFNTAVGIGSLLANTTGNSNTAIGYNSLNDNTTGNNNTATGNRALYTNSSGVNNTANGYFSLNSNYSGNDNTATGNRSLWFNTTGNNNAGYGSLSLSSNNSGSSNTAIGYGSLYSNTTGNNNIASGYNAGKTIADGISLNSITDNSLFLGAYTKALANNQTNQIVIGYDATGIGSNSVVLGNDSILTTALKGNIGIGTTTPSYKLDVSGGTGIVGQFSGRVIGGNAVSNNEFVTLSQLTSNISSSNLWQLNNAALSPSISSYDVLVGGNATGSALIKLGGTANSNSFFNTGGNVGIGMSSPTAAKLDINGGNLMSANTYGVRSVVNTNGSSTAAYYADVTNYGNNVGTGYYANVTDSTAQTSFPSGYYASVTTSGTGVKWPRGFWVNINDSSTGVLNNSVDGIYASVSTTGVYTSGTKYIYGGELQVAASGASTGGTQNVYGLRLLSESNGTIGGVANVYGLSVAGGGYVASGGTGVVNSYGVYIKNPTGMNTNGTSSNIGLYVEQPTGADVNYAAIFEGGNVGIGTTTPLAKLDVNGDIYTRNGGAVRTYNSAGTHYLYMVHDGANPRFGGDGGASIVFSDTGNRIDLNPNGSYVTISGGGELNFAYEDGVTNLYRKGTGRLGTNSTLQIDGGNTAGKAALIVNQIGAVANDIFTASASGTTRFIIKNNGNVGIGTTSPNTLLHVGSTSIADATTLITLQDVNSSCTLNANTGSPTCGSDITLKKDVLSLNTSDLLTKISALRPVSYHWKTDGSDAQAQHGFIAQEVAAQFPELVTEGIWNDGTTRKFLNMGGLMPYVVGAIGAQQGQITSLSNLVTGLPSQSSQITANNAQLTSLQSSVLSLQNTSSSHSAEIASLTSDLADLKRQVLGASISANFAAGEGLGLGSTDATLSGTLSVLGRSTFTDIGVTGKIISGLMSIDGAEGSLNVMGDLRLQANGYGTVDMFAGKLVVDKDGNLVTSGAITAKKLNLDETDSVGKSVGEAVIPVGSLNLDVNTTALSSKSRIFVTPDQAVVVGATKKDQDTFTIKLQSAQSTDVKVNWLIIN